MGRVVAGRHELLDLVSVGGQGEVWRARDLQHDRVIAMKIVPIEVGVVRAELLQEARLLLEVRPHPGLPIVREDFFDGDSYCIVMDWIDGTSLADILARHGSPGLPFDTVLPYLRQVASALEQLHAHDPPILHRDVKPSNVMVRTDGGVVLVDFGIAAASGGVAARAGTPSYHAPELAAGGADRSADVYGLAATTFALLAGSPPAPGPRPAMAGVPTDHVSRVWRALDAGLAYDPSRRPASAREFVAALEPARSVTNLPRFASRFVGRETEVAAISESLTTERLVTLVGTGGLGKTRLAIEAARRIGAAYADGVWIAELASVPQSRLVARAVGSALGVDEPTASASDGLIAALADRTMLLVLDNCEHVLDGCLNLVTRVLEACPGVDILATSRERLGSPSEVVHEVAPLALPADGATDEGATQMKTAALCDSIRLFLDRAVDVQLTAATLPTIVQICRHLDGMPLAIELAASRTERLSLEEIAHRLQDRFALLQTDEPSTRRHQTLRATFDWSVSLLSDGHSDTFSRLGVLPGGFDGAGARAVSFDTASESEDLASVLTDLVAKSLVVRVDDQPRYSMLETVREFALDQLRARGEETQTRDRALRWLVALAIDALGQLEGPERAVWFRRLSSELDNIRATVVYAIDAHPEDAMRLVTSLEEFWAVRGHWAEARRYLAECFAADVGTVELRACAAATAGRLAYLAADYDAARRSHGDALRMRKAIADRNGEWRSLASLGMVAEARSDLDSARDLYGQSLAICRELGDERGIAEQLSNLGNVAEYDGAYDIAQALHEQSLATRRALGDTRGAATTLLNLGYVMNYRGDASGKSILEESAALFTEVGDRHGASRAINLLAIRAWFEGDAEKARSLGEDAMRMRHEIGDRLGIAVSLESLAGLAAFQGHGIYAGELFGAAERLRGVIASPVTPSDRALLQWAHTDARKAVGDEAFDAARARGRMMSIDIAVELALQRPELIETATADA